MKRFIKIYFLLIIFCFSCGTDNKNYHRIDDEFNSGSKINYIKLDSTKINDLKITGLVWGFLKYFHPNVIEGQYNWDYELFRILAKVIESENFEQTNDILNCWIESLGHFKKLDNEQHVENIKLNSDLNWILNNNLSNKLISQLLLIKNAKRLNKSFYIDFVNGANNPIFKNENPYSSFSFPDNGYRLLCLFRYWNIIQYYYPYRNLLERNWENVLSDYILKFNNNKNELQYKLTCLELISEVNDTHANIWSEDNTLDIFFGNKTVPVEINFIENRPIVIREIENSLSKPCCLQVGDEILEIDNIDIRSIILEKIKYCPASNYNTKLREVAKKIIQTNSDTIEILIENKNGIFNKKVPTVLIKKIDLWYKEVPSNKVLIEKIGYIYPGNLKKGEIDMIMKSFINKKGIIVDLRCYPSDFIVFSLGKYLMPRPTQFAKFSIASITNPGVFTFTEPINVGEKNNNYFRGKVLILVNEKTQSQAEYTAMALRVAPNALVIGSKTAAADGNVSRIFLPGNIKTVISGIGVYYPDGSETQRIGIIPDIEVVPTIKGIRNRKDEVLENAIEIILN